VTERAASRTAVLVCQGRAVADGRVAVGRFADPVARRLDLVSDNGFRVSRDDDLLALADGIDVTGANTGSLRNGRVAVADSPLVGA
jgi:hypothetical protein